MIAAMAVSAGCWGAGTFAAGSGYSFGGTDGKSGNCLDCHAVSGKVGDRFFIDPVKYGQTTHARIGCPSCHDSVAAAHQPRGGKSPKTECAGCHADILAEYGVSVHAPNAGCSGCHDPHRVKTPLEISGPEVNRMCASCHDGYRMTALHAEWLPQADLHLDMLPCVSCHTGSKDYVITMYVVKRNPGIKSAKLDLATYDELKKLAGDAEILSLIDNNGDGYISLAELRIFNRSHERDPLRLKGMITPERVTHSFQILDNRRNCTFCHASGPGAMQTSFLAVPEQNGTLKRVAVEKGAVLDALYATPDFYMTGATRNRNLNVVGGLILAGGLVMPVGHGFLRALTRKNRKGKENGHE
jgi:predicted CXXCH cytochrome family protein